MYISGFSVAGFGRLRPQSLEGLSAGLNIFLGENEAGKSTCLEFFRTMLLGYPGAHKKKERRFPPVYGKAEGGALLLEGHGLLGPYDGAIRLSRKREEKAPLLQDAEGKPLDEISLARLFGGVTRELYHSVYGFSLKELQDFSSISGSDEVRNALYGASFGLTAHPPAEVIRRIKAEMEGIFTPLGQKKQRTRSMLDRLAEVRESLRRQEMDAPRYDALQEELAAVEAEIARLRADLAERGSSLHNDERLAAAWPQWEECLQIKARLALPELAIHNFPPDALPRLERCLEKREQAQHSLLSAKERHDALHKALAALTPDAALAACLPEARSLAERKASYRAALSGLSGVSADLERARAERNRSLAVLGPDWTIERVAAFDRSLFTYEDIAACERALRAAESARERAFVLNGQAQAEKERAKAEQERLEAGAGQCVVPEAEAALSALAPERLEQLRSLRAQAEFAVAGLPSLREEQRRAEERLAGAFLEISPVWTAEHLRERAPQSLLPGMRANAQALAGDLIRSRQTRAEAAQALNDPRARLEELKEQRAHLLERGVSTDPPGMDIENRARSLAELRRLPAELTLAEERLAGAERELAAHDAARPQHEPRRALRVWAVVAFCLCVLCVLPLALDRSGLLPSVTVFEGLVRNAPVLFSPYGALLNTSRALGLSWLFLLVGVGFLWLGRPRLRKEHLRSFEERREALSVAREQAAQALEAQESRLGHLLDAARIPEFTELALNTAEAELERERREQGRLEQVAHNLAECDALLEKATERHNARRSLLDSATQAENAAQSAWREHLASLDLPPDSAPEEAGALYGRIAAAQLLAGQIRALLEQCDAARETVRRLAQYAGALPGFAAPSESFENPADLFALLDAWLADCRRAQDRCLESERRRALAMAQAEEAKRLSLVAIKASSSLRAADAELTVAASAWKDWLTRSGLVDSLTPESARQALESMERCLRLHGECASLAARHSALERDIQALEVPLTALLARVDRTAPATAPDTLAALDLLVADAEQASALIEERARLEHQTAEAAQRVHDAENSLATANTALADLLDAAESPDEESFRRRAAAFDERRSLLRRAGDLDVTLRLAAGTTSGEEAAVLFAAVDHGALKDRMRVASDSMQSLNTQENVCQEKAAGLRVGLKSLLTRSQAASLRREEAGLQEDLRTQALEWARLALTRHLITTAKRRFEQERQPDVIRRAGRLFAAITNERWSGVSASLDDANLAVLDESQSPMANEHLSRGAQEQLYLAMRLAYLQDHARRSQPLPLIMDDILVNFDPERAGRTARVLAEVIAGEAGTPGHQLLFFTCHPTTAELLATAVPAAARFSVDDGFVRSALPS